RIDLSLLLNGYPPHFITQQFNRFFYLNNRLSISQQINEQVYSHLHHNLLYQQTLSEKKFQAMMEDPVKTPLVLQPKIWNKAIMYPRYLFDTSLAINFRQEFTNWWKTYYAFSGSPLEQIQVRLIPITGRTLETFFIHKKPPRAMLTKMEPRS
ncbi:unnamed protein product, partial [Adineta steineri]